MTDRIMLTAALPDKIDTGEIADLLRVSRPHVTDKLTKKPDFPTPVVNRSRKMRLWLRSEIEAWARGHSRPAMSSDDIR
jgi:predicted DNA-binding transcriptional regulator AlpA